MSEKILPCQQFGDPPFVNIVPDTLIKYTSIAIILRGIVGTLKTFLYKIFVPVHKMPGVNISQKTRNYSVREGNETYKISKLFRSSKKKWGSFLLLLN